jgi:hypothetical protein
MRIFEANGSFFGFVAAERSRLIDVDPVTLGDCFFQFLLALEVPYCIHFFAPEKWFVI